MKTKIFYTLLFSLYFSVHAQVIKLDMFQCIQMASDSSLQAFQAQNLYLASYWEYRSYKAARLPSFGLSVTPVQYSRTIMKRYDYNENIEVYRAQQTLNSSAGVSVSQNLDLTGGTIFVESDLGFLRNFGDVAYTQFSAVPIRIGYSQSLFGYNNFKWEKKLEPLKFEQAKKKLIYQLEEIAENVVHQYYSLLLADAEYQMALENQLTTDTLYQVGLEREKISAISQAEVLTLELDAMNAINAVVYARQNLKQARFNLSTYLKVEGEVSPEEEISFYVPKIRVPIEEALMYAQIHNPTYMEYRQDILLSEQNLERARKTSSFDMSLSGSIGFNQAAESLRGVYRSPLQQDIVTVGVSIPIFDWGMRKGKVNMAKSNLTLTRLAVEQKKQVLEQEIVTAIENFHIQQDLMDSAEKALDLSKKAYNNTKERFIIGKSDVNSVMIALSRQKDAQRNYINSLKQYWLGYYQIRKLTLFDFERNQPLSELIDEKIYHL